MNAVQNLSRRGFLKGIASAGALVLAARIAPQSVLAADSLPATTALFQPNLFVSIDTDGTVYIVAHRSEMGTGIRTSLPLVLADELDAEWKLVRIKQADGDERYGDQNTDGSHSIRSFFDTMRRCGATARLMMMRAAALQWNVPIAECATELHAVVHQPSGRRLAYGDLASAAAKLPVPGEHELIFKPPTKRRYIGKGVASYDLVELCTGKAAFGIDARMDGMVYASIEHPPVLGGRIKSYDDKDALAVAGVQRTIPITPFEMPYEFQPLGGVAVIADNTWATFQGRRKLKIEWDDGPNASYNSATFKQEIQATARKPGRVARAHGDVDAAFAGGAKVFEAEYYVPHLAHAAMEPLNAVASYRDGKVELFAPTQNPQAAQKIIASELGIPISAVTCHVTLLGGGFGRKSKPDYVAEAAILSKKVGRPVKVMWSREDDTRFDYYHTVSAMYLKAALGSDGMPQAWLQRSVFPPIASTFEAGAEYGESFDLAQGWTDVPFHIPNLRVENGPAAAHVRIGWLRSVANIYHAFAVQTFADELAHEVRRDPIDYQLDLIGKPRILDLRDVDYANYGADYEQYPIDTGRLRQVIEMVAEKSGWAKHRPQKGHALGFAAHRSFLTYVATVVEVEVSDDGKIRIPRVDTVVDAGLVANPVMAHAQFEGAAVFGASIAKFGEITATHGRIDQANFYNYKVARMPDAPYRTNVYFVESDAPPAGVGEPGVPPFVPAFCNAIFAATGTRVRELPLARHKLTA